MTQTHQTGCRILFSLISAVLILSSVAVRAPARAESLEGGARAGIETGHVQKGVTADFVPPDFTPVFDNQSDTPAYITDILEKEGSSGHESALPSSWNADDLIGGPAFNFSGEVGQCNPAPQKPILLPWHPDYPKD
jgi:hypothetical protein